MEPDEYRAMEAYCIVKCLCLEDGATDYVPMAVLLDYKSARELADGWNRSSIDTVFDVKNVRLAWRESSCPHCGSYLPSMADTFSFCPYCASWMGEDDEAV